MALPTITFNSGTGSDTAASGAGPGTALFGTAAATVAANNIVTLAVDAPDLSGVATDGSAVIYVNSSSGRKFSKITAIDNTAKTVTCQDNFANTEGTRGWGIGGKRATLAATLTLGVDVYQGWIVILETDQTITTTYTITPTAGSAGDGKFMLKGDSASSRRIITNTANATSLILSAALSYGFENLHFKNSNGTKSAARCLGLNGSNFTTVKNCIFGDATNKVKSVGERTSGSPVLMVVDCEIKNCTNNVVGSCPSAQFVNCWIHNNDIDGITVDSASTVLIVTDCVINANAGDGIKFGAAGFGSLIARNTFHGNTGDGLDTGNSTSNVNRLVCHSNNFTANGGYGWNSVAGTGDVLPYAGFNNYGTGATANTSGARNNVSAGDGDLAVDPQYTNVAGIDFSVGTNVKALGYPDASKFIGANQSATKSYVDIGGAQRQESGGGGGPLVGPGRLIRS